MDGETKRRKGKGNSFDSNPVQVEKLLLFDPELLEELGLNENYFMLELGLWGRSYNEKVLRYIMSNPLFEGNERLALIVYELLLNYKYAKRDSFDYLEQKKELKVQKVKYMKYLDSSLTNFLKEPSKENLYKLFEGTPGFSFSPKIIKKLRQRAEKLNITSSGIEREHSPHSTPEHLMRKLSSKEKEEIFNSNFETYVHPLYFGYREDDSIEFKSRLLLANIEKFIFGKFLDSRIGDPLDKLIKEILAMANSQSSKMVRYIIFGIEDYIDENEHPVISGSTYDDVGGISGLKEIIAKISETLVNTCIYNPITGHLGDTARTFCSFEYCHTMYKGNRHNLFVVRVQTVEKLEYPYVYRLKQHDAWYGRNSHGIVHNYIDKKSFKNSYGMLCINSSYYMYSTNIDIQKVFMMLLIFVLIGIIMYK